MKIAPGRELLPSVAARWATIALTLGGIAAPGIVRASGHHHDADHALVVFPTAVATARADSDARHTSEGDTLIGIDAIFGVTRGRFRVFGEFLADTEEVALERAQIGFEPIDDTLVWVGRFHQPGNIWTVARHHGQYLQTSITRPQIETWEDDRGFVPQHIVGVLLESQRATPRGHGLQFAMGAGKAPALTEEGLSPFDVFDDNWSAGGDYIGLRAAWLPDYVGENSVGVVASINTLAVAPGILGVARQIRVRTYGGFIDWSQQPWRSIGAVYRLETQRVATAGSGFDGVWSGYLQAERTLGAKWTGFGRYEFTSGADDSQYLRLFEDIHDRTLALGLRRELPHKNAVTFEVDRVRLRGDGYSEFRLQWSAAIP